MQYGSVKRQRTSIVNILAVIGKEHFLRALRPAGCAPAYYGSKEVARPASYPALRRSVPRSTRDRAPRAGLKNSAPQSGAGVSCSLADPITLVAVPQALHARKITIINRGYYPRQFQIHILFCIMHRTILHPP